MEGKAKPVVYSCFLCPDDTLTQPLKSLEIIVSLSLSDPIQSTALFRTKFLAAGDIPVNGPWTESVKAIAFTLVINSYSYFFKRFTVHGPPAEWATMYNSWAGQFLMKFSQTYWQWWNELFKIGIGYLVLWQYVKFGFSTIAEYPS